MILAAVSLASAGEKSNTANAPIKFGYDILYGGLKIGEIDLDQSQPYEIKGRPVTELDCSIKSDAVIEHKGLYKSIVTADYSVLYLLADITTLGNRRIDEYWFDYDNRKIRGKITIPDKKEISNFQYDFKDPAARYFDSISLVFRLRDGLDTLKAPFYIPVFVYARLDSILIDSITDDMVVVPDGKGAPAKHVSGKIPFATYPGVGDRFDLFISDNVDKIPLKAVMQMAVGKIEIIPRVDKKAP